MKITSLFKSLIILQALTVGLLSEKPETKAWLDLDDDANALFGKRGSQDPEFGGLPTENDVLATDLDTSAQAPDVSTYGGTWKIIGSGLVKLVKFIEVTIKGTCLSIGATAEKTCGGLKPDTCGRLDALRESVAKLKAEAGTAIHRNDELHRWNATNVKLGYEMSRIVQVMDNIVTINAQMMDLTGTLKYDRKKVAVDGSEMVDESGKPLADYKLSIKMQPSEFIAKVTKLLEVAETDKNAKDKIAFGVALGLGMSAQSVPDVLLGMLGLSEEIADVKDRLLVTLGSTDTNVTYGYQYATRRQFFANMTRGTASAILADAQSTGLSGFFDLLIDPAVADKVAEHSLSDGNRVRVEEGASPEFLRRLKETKTLNKLVEITKMMPDVDFDKFITTASAKDPFEVLKDLEIHEIPTNPHGIDIKVIKKLQKGFKNFEKFFTEVKKSLDVASQRFQQTGLTWNKVGYYGFSALQQLARFSNLALCVLNIITTVKGAREMRLKIAQAEVETKNALEEIEDARVKGEKLLQLQKSLHKGVNDDIVKIIEFSTHPLKDIDNIPTDFSARVRRVQQFLGLYASNKIIRDTSVDRTRDVGLFFISVRGLMQGFFRLIMRQKHVVQLAKSNIEIEVIKKVLEKEGHRVKDIYHVLNLLAFSDEFQTTATYDSFPLECIRRKTIQSETGLENWFRSRPAARVVPQTTKSQIMTMVHWFRSSADEIVTILEQTRHICHSPVAFSLSGSLAHVHCSREDVLTVIALDVLPNETTYKGDDLTGHRPSYDCNL